MSAARTRLPSSSQASPNTSQRVLALVVPFGPPMRLANALPSRCARSVRSRGAVSGWSLPSTPGNVVNVVMFGMPVER